MPRIAMLLAALCIAVAPTIATSKAFAQKEPDKLDKTDKADKANKATSKPEADKANQFKAGGQARAAQVKIRGGIPRDCSRSAAQLNQLQPRRHDECRSYAGCHVDLARSACAWSAPAAVNVGADVPPGLARPHRRGDRIKIATGVLLLHASVHGTKEPCRHRT